MFIKIITIMNNYCHYHVDGKVFALSIAFVLSFILGIESVAFSSDCENSAYPDQYPFQENSKSSYLYISVVGTENYNKCIVWDSKNSILATNIPLDSGGFATFPVDPIQISNWLAVATSESQELYKESDNCGRSNNDNALTVQCNTNLYCPAWSTFEAHDSNNEDLDSYCPGGGDIQGLTDTASCESTCFGSAAPGADDCAFGEWNYIFKKTIQSTRFNVTGADGIAHSVSLSTNNDSNIETSFRTKYQYENKRFGHSYNWDTFSCPADLPLSYRSQFYESFEFKERKAYTFLTPIGEMDHNVETIEGSEGIHCLEKGNAGCPGFGWSEVLISNQRPEKQSFENLEEHCSPT